MAKTILITGASSGIGKACAKELLMFNHHLILTSRRKSVIQEWVDLLDQEKIKATFEIDTLDVTQGKQVDQFFDGLEKEGVVLHGLINNAGFAKGTDRIKDADRKDWQEMMDTNFLGAFHVAKRSIALMPKHQGARIINIGSIAGLQAYPGGGGYCASKFALKALTQTLRFELLEMGIGVTSIDPGLVDTNFSQVRFQDLEKAKKVYEGLEPLHAQDIAEMVLFVLSRPAHVNIDQMVTMPLAQAGPFHIVRNQGVSS